MKLRLSGKLPYTKNTWLQRVRSKKLSAFGSQMWRGIYYLMASLMLLCSTSAFADKVWMDNGDVLTGKIQGLAAGKLKLKTKYTEIIFLDWQYVRSIAADKPLWVGLISEEYAQKRQVEHRNNQFVLIDEDGYEHRFAAVWPVAEIRTDKPLISHKWEVSGKVNAGLDSSQGNDNDTNIDFDGRFEVNDKWNKNALKWHIELEQDDDGDRAQAYVFGYAYSRYLTQHWYIQGNLDQKYDTDPSDDLTSRIRLGSSLGYRHWETRNTALFTGFGLTQLWEDYIVDDNQKPLALTFDAMYRKFFLDNLEYFADSRSLYRLNRK